MKYPKISLIVPAYNEHEIIDSALRHMTQEIKYPNYEILLAVDGDDNSIDIARRYARKYKNLKISYSKERRGIFLAENAAMKLATGTILIKFDCDARFLEPEKALYNIAKNFENPKVGALFFDCQHVPIEEKRRSITVRGEAFVMKLVSNYMESLGTIKGKWDYFMVVNSIRSKIVDSLEVNSIVDDIQFAYATLEKGYEIKFTPDVKYYKIGNPPSPSELFKQKRRNYNFWLRVKEKNKNMNMYRFYWWVFKYFLKNIYKYSLTEEIIPFFYWGLVFSYAMINANIINLFKGKPKQHIEWYKIRRVEKK
jgi:poly-beta-1,6-N-acetyl-D-glucosamine synthase